MNEKQQQACDDLLALLQGLKTALAVFAESNDLTPPQLWALYIIMHGETTMGKLAVTLHCDASNVTGIVDRLVARDLITSKILPHDRRAKILGLTAKGHKVIDACMLELPERLGIERLDKIDRQNLHVIVAKLPVISQPVVLGGTVVA